LVSIHVATFAIAAVLKTVISDSMSRLLDFRKYCFQPS